ncbi:hypothetical protein E8L99_14365 [Phreatobacter aquaticus]|uniref:Uncharacterized protein n=1 Tax=Phreatobacter aquaticus TaxID=2570229 RepID=A0A4D7QLH4_9HYPH|nr:hypothetical protein [Phreatobacter aquaticus]QCK86853.1 hypothetical protein E8L99_14365 [Phreatobacter aquaticus]
MKSILSLALLVGLSGATMAQGADTCAGYLKTLEEMRTAMRASGTALPAPEPTDAAIEAYCKKNPTAPLATAMEKALSQ